MVNSSSPCLFLLVTLALVAAAASILRVAVGICEARRESVD